MFDSSGYDLLPSDKARKEVEQRYLAKKEAENIRFIDILYVWAVIFFIIYIIN